MDSKIINCLANDWRSAGITAGDHILVHSSISRTLRRIAKMGGKPTPRLIIASFLKVIGDSGTLILPLFNFDFTKGIKFEISNSPSHMGALTQAGRLWPSAVRSGHPIYSFAAIGSKAKLFNDLKNFSGYGNDSPFGILHRLGGKIAVLDLPDQNSMTFYHYVEESLNAPYRYHKTFTGHYIDAQGHESLETFGLYVRNIAKGIQTHVNPMGEILWEKGLYTGCRPNEGCGLRVIRAPEIFTAVAAILTAGKAKGILYEIN